MKNGNKAPNRQRIVFSSVLTFAVVWAFGTRAANGELDTWLRVGSMLTALYGGYLFGHFAVRGRLPGVLTSEPEDTGRHSGNARDA